MLQLTYDLGSGLARIVSQRYFTFTFMPGGIKTTFITFTFMPGLSQKGNKTLFMCTEGILWQRQFNPSQKNFIARALLARNHNQILLQKAAVPLLDYVVLYI